MLRRILVVCCGVSLAIAAGLVDHARAASWLEMNFWLSGPRYDGVVPACDEPAALDTIVARFAQKESEFWNSSLTILAFRKVRETAHSPWAPNTIPRRFCRAVVQISNGRWTPVYYWIGEDTGMIGATWGVRWCVVGYDRDWTYNPACKMARP